MIARFEELDWQSTPLGDLTLRRRNEPAVGHEIYEVKLGDEYLMSSLFTVAEEALATLGLDATSGSGLNVLVGGLGLGYTAVAALRDERAGILTVGALTVIDRLAAVIRWHERRLLPVSTELVDDPRTALVCDDFFAVMRMPPPTDAMGYDAILLDVDHSPRHQLDPSHGALYSADGMRSLDRHLVDGGVFALWSDDPPDAAYMAVLRGVFDDAEAHVIDFANAVTGGTSSNTVYVARSRRRGPLT
ncbi:spermidine synthase [Microbacterium rhizomatis]|uniref:Spermidine synthase n=1 Tax=Microbacterium rhizomatis TaxID=1631477 RepID=A0A5J5IVL8_9MICO|nr:spermidine synthase [Microbacterium rhizomatis]KAA9105040.1 spermidine synthase [Microbacterium rhizomatis]